MLAISIMVKNEEESILRTLKPIIENNITSIHIHDTGSTDKTIDVISEYSDDIFITTGEFTTYSETRNETLKITKNLFPDVDFILMIDADWIPENLNDLLNFCTTNKNNEEQAYMINVLIGSKCKQVTKNNKTYYIEDNLNKNHSSVTYARLLNAKNLPTFVNILHEQPDNFSNEIVPNFLIRWNETSYGKNKTLKRVLNYDIPYLISCVYDDKNTNKEVYYYLGQSYEFINNIEKSLEWYKETVKLHMPGSFLAAYKIGCIYKDDNRLEAVKYLKIAIAIDKTRAEPYVILSSLIDNSIDKYKLTHKAINVPDVPTVKQYVNKSIYDSYRYVLHIKHCILLNKYDEIVTVLDKLDNLSEEHNKELVSYLDTINQKTVILILTSPGYEDYNKIMKEYLNIVKIPYFFYMYDTSKVNDNEQFTIIDNYIYFRGNETMIPGILKKTVDSIKIMSKLGFDNIIRINSTTFVDFYQMKPGLTHNCQYFGYYISEKLKENDQYGVTKKFIEENGQFPFISGKFICFNKNAIEKICSGDLDYSVMDDVAFGKLFKTNEINLKNEAYKYSDNCDNKKMVICTSPDELDNVIKIWTLNLKNLV